MAHYVADSARLPAAGYLLSAQNPIAAEHWFTKLCERSGTIYAAPADS